MRIWVFFLLLILPFRATAQLCEGAPGAAALSEGFGQGTNFGPPLPTGSTTYIYNDSSPSGGTYMVTNRTQLNGANWHAGLDNTPDDGFGYMLLFDATAEPGEFFNLLLEGLCPGTHYEFSAYLTNVVTPSACGGESIEPNVRFELRDPDTNELLGSIQTGAMPTTPFLRWDQYGLTFTLPEDQDAVRLLLINSAPGGCGNDLAIDDISLRICNPVREQTATLCSSEPLTIDGRVFTGPGIYQDTLPGARFCNDSILITEILDGFRDVVMLDTFLCPGQAFAVGDRWYDEPGFYTDTLLSSLGCDSVVQLQLSGVDFEASVQASRDTIIAGESVQLQGSGSGVGPLIWSWQPEEAVDCNDCPAPMANLLETTTFMLTVRDSTTGCADTLEQQIVIPPCEDVYTPTAFSPNNDGRNDTFQIFFGPCVQEVLQLEVFDRWGGLVFRSRTSNDTWDGQRAGVPCNNGLYVYQAVLALKDGTNRVWKGSVQLLR
jgi:gliding motility-associated-like protein